MTLPPDLRATEKEIIEELKSKNIEVNFAITDYDTKSKILKYKLSCKPNLNVPPEAQAIVDKRLKAYRDSQPNFLLFHRR